MYKNILIPTDGSALSRRAVAKGVKLAKSVGAIVTGFYAAPPRDAARIQGSVAGLHRSPEARPRHRTGDGALSGGDREGRKSRRSGLQDGERNQ